MQHSRAGALSHVYWIGGSPCAGKTSAANAIVASFGMASYNCDDAWVQHEQWIDPDQHPTMYRLSRSTCDELWMRPVDQQVREEIGLYREEFPIVIDELLSMPTDRPILAEGSGLMPRFLHELGIPVHRAIWLVPMPAFQHDYYARRDWRYDQLADCSNKEQAWHNWMERDIGFANVVRAEANECGRRLIDVDGSNTLTEVHQDVVEHFGLTPEVSGERFQE